MTNRGSSGKSLNGQGFPGTKISGYRCFGAEPQGFDETLPINIIIGQNNAGKSALLDAIEAAVTGAKSLGRGAALHFTRALQESELATVFTPGTSGGRINGEWGQYGRQFMGRPFTWRLEHTSNKDAFKGQVLDARTDTMWHDLATKLGNPWSLARFYKLGAARDVVPQTLGAISSEGWKPDGSSVTSLINAFVNMANLPPEAVTSELLTALNKIVSPVAFKSLVPRALDAVKQVWELFLEEEHKSRVPLSASGTGYKTAISILAMVDLMPKFHGVELSRCVFGIEELENNLHPALQRRLLAYLRKRAVEGGATFFLTTHSNVVIDVFQGDKVAQIVHVEHDRRLARASTAVAKDRYRAILDDLDVRASDLLQSNCVVWVEGPSDRKYFNRWLELLTDGKLREGTQYRCLFYGGKILSHFSADDTDTVDEFVALLEINRHAIIVMDRDRSNSADEINATKRRVRDEVERAGGIAWITAGREIENYIPPAVVWAGVELQGHVPSEFDKIQESLKAHHDEHHKIIERSKVAFADVICPQLTRQSLLQHLDLGDQLNRVAKKIMEWNAM